MKKILIYSAIALATGFVVYKTYKKTVPAAAKPAPVPTTKPKEDTGKEAKIDLLLGDK